MFYLWGMTFNIFKIIETADEYDTGDDSFSKDERISYTMTITKTYATISYIYLILHCTVLFCVICFYRFTVINA